MLLAGSVYSDFGAYLKFGQPPGWRYSQYDLRPRWSFGEEQDSNMEIAFDPTTPGFQTGTYSAPCSHPTCSIYRPGMLWTV